MNLFSINSEDTFSPDSVNRIGGRPWIRIYPVKKSLLLDEPCSYIHDLLF